MRGSSREEPCNDRLFWYNISFKQRFLGCYAKENSTITKLWHGPWAPALVQSHHNSRTVVPYLKDIKSVIGPYFVLSVLFPCLPNYPTKMCPVMTVYILVLPRHKIYVLLYTHPSDMFLTWPEPVKQDPKFGFGHHLSFSQKDESSPRANKKKKMHIVLLSAIRTHR
jgi:hypothetical protein